MLSKFLLIRKCSFNFLGILNTTLIIWLQLHGCIYISLPYPSSLSYLLGKSHHISHSSGNLIPVCEWSARPALYRESRLRRLTINRDVDTSQKSRPVWWWTAGTKGSNTKGSSQEANTFSVTLLTFNGIREWDTISFSLSFSLSHTHTHACSWNT